MNAVTDLNSLSTLIDDFTATAMRIKAERDEFEAALKDLRLGADMMLEPALGLRGAMLGYVKEVRRVADEALKFDAHTPAFLRRQAE